MILTCPDCHTKYVVKDGAIPLGGRQVRCASCKHSWHQDPESADDDQAQKASGEPDEMQIAVEEMASAIVEQPAFPTVDTPTPFDPIQSEPPTMPPPPPAPPARAEDRQWQSVEPASAWNEPAVEPTRDPIDKEAPLPVTEDFEPFYDHEPIEQPKRKWPLFLLLALMVALAAIAFWFLAPAELRARAGLASARDSQLYAVVNTGDYQRLASGNNLFTVSGRIVNSTDSRQPVPPIRAELLDGTKQKVIYSWTISPPVASLDLNKSTNFNSAEIDVPEGGEFIRIRLGGPA